MREIVLTPGAMKYAAWAAILILPVQSLGRTLWHQGAPARGWRLGGPPGSV